MKKVFFAVLMCLSLASFAQKDKKMSYRVGLLLPVPANVEGNYRVDVGSSLVEAGYKVNKNVSIVMNTGFVRFEATNGGTSFTNVPILIGGRYFINNNIYFGVSAGPAFFNKESAVNDRMLYTPHVGYQKGHLSLDARYMNWYDFPNEYNNLSMCVSYTL